MDLWIRSQDGRELVKAEHIEAEQISDDEVSFNVNGYSLGSYRTKERALEVLDEIQTLLMQQQLLVFKNADITTDELEAMKKVGAVAIQEGQKEAEIKYISPSSFVYQMPKK